MFAVSAWDTVKVVAVKDRPVVSTQSQVKNAEVNMQHTWYTLLVNVSSLRGYVQ